MGYILAWVPGARAELGSVQTGHFLSQLRIHAQEPHLLQERDPEDDWQGVLGAREVVVKGGGGRGKSS